MQRHTADIFCKVIDNFGDAGVCWRLARQLAGEHGLQVRLLIDRPDALARLLPALQLALADTGSMLSSQRFEGVEIVHWQQDIQPLAGPPADLVIAAFACDLPPAYRDSMHGLGRFMGAPLAGTSSGPGSASPALSHWINLEYLSAETWVAEHHALPSLKPSGLVEQFYFPGFTADTGGLIREAGLLARRDAFCRNPAARLALAHELGLTSLDQDGLDESLLILVFCYPGAPFAELLAAAGAALAGMAHGNLSTSLSTGFSVPLSSPLSAPLSRGLSGDLSTALPAHKGPLSPAPSRQNEALSTANPDLSRALPTTCPQRQPAPVSRPLRHIRFLLPEGLGSVSPPRVSLPPGLSVHTIPPLPQSRFDELLWLCDANFVRGEDSLVRALWAGKPLLWHIYPQSDEAHHGKLEAFLALRPKGEGALCRAWNSLSPAASLAPAFAQWLHDFPALQQASATCTRQLAAQPDLACRLLSALGWQHREIPPGSGRGQP